MKRDLTWWDLAWFGVGAGIFVLTGQEAKEVAGPAVVVSGMLSVFCYTEFAVEIPVAAGPHRRRRHHSHLRLRRHQHQGHLPPQLPPLHRPHRCHRLHHRRRAHQGRHRQHAPGALHRRRGGGQHPPGALHRRRGGGARVDVLLRHAAQPPAQRLPHPRLLSLSADYSQLDPIAVVVITLICAFAVISTKGSSRLNYLLSIVHIGVIVFIIVTGLTKADTANMRDFTPFGARGIFAASAVLFFAYIGFDAVSTMAEETKNPARDIPIGLVGSMAITTALYCVLAVTLCLMQPYGAIDKDAPFSDRGMNWAKYIVAFGALKGMTTVPLVSAVGQARYLTHIARTHMMPPWLAQVHPRTGTPVNATVVMLFATAVIAFFTDLAILSNLLSISTLFIFMLVTVALLVRRYYVTGETTAADRNKLVACITAILATSVATATCWGLNVDGWVPYAVTVPAWLASTVCLWALVPQARTPKLWGAPLVPSASIAINIFLLGSIDAKSFERFGIWSAALLVYYLFVGLHASYDEAKAIAAEAHPGKVEDGDAGQMAPPTNGK